MHIDIIVRVDGERDSIVGVQISHGVQGDVELKIVSTGLTCAAFWRGIAIRESTDSSVVNHLRVSTPPCQAVLQEIQYQDIVYAKQRFVFK